MNERPPIRHFAIVRFRKSGALRFLSHLDLNRAMHRAVRRAGLPVKYSQGFNPSALIGYAQALPVGTGGERELCQIELERPMPADEVHRALAAALPEDLAPVETKVVSGETKKHLSGLTVAEYEMELSAEDAPEISALRAAAEELVQAGELPVTRETKSETRDVDIRPGILELAVFEACPGKDAPGPRLRMKLALDQERYVKPSEVIECLERRLAGLMGQDVRLHLRVVTRLDLARE